MSILRLLEKEATRLKEQAEGILEIVKAADGKESAEFYHGKIDQLNTICQKSDELLAKGAKEYAEVLAGKLERFDFHLFKETAKIRLKELEKQSRELCDQKLGEEELKRRVLEIYDESELLNLKLTLVHIMEHETILKKLSGSLNTSYQNEDGDLWTELKDAATAWGILTAYKFYGSVTDADCEEEALRLLGQKEDHYAFWEMDEFCETARIYNRLVNKDGEKTFSTRRIKGKDFLVHVVGY